MPYTNLTEHKYQRICKQQEFRNIHKNQFDSLSNREKEIIALIIEGNTSTQAAYQLSISPSTVDQHRKNINRKLEIHCIQQLFPYALAFDLV